MRRADAQNRGRYRKFEVGKMRPYVPNIDYSVKWLTENLDPNAHASSETDSNLRKTNPAISPSNMLPNTTGKGPNISTQRRK